ncbi:hypothetical protein [Pseudomonas costantinii]|uniref:hypothetical protein n=1 Tax=Pseudomonas costantinii TaxID=168469 RepID=UPI0034E938B9
MAEENEIDLENPAIKAAIATAVEASVSGLKTKNTELLGKLKDTTGKLTQFETQFEGIDIDAVKRAQIVGAGNQAELEKVIAALRAEHGSIQILVDGLEAGEIHRPESGDLALRLFEVLGTIHASVGELTSERDGLALTVDALRAEVEALKKAALTPPADEAGEITALKAKLDDANIQYRANASKESLEKLVAELTKE